MITATPDIAQQLSLTKRMLVEEMLSRGWQVWLYDLSLPLMRVKRDGLIIELYSSAAPELTYRAAQVAENKYLTALLYADAGIPMPKTWLLSDDGVLPEEVGAELKAGHQLVVKPLDAAHGRGVHVGVQSEEKLRAAITDAKQYGSGVLVQEAIMGAQDIRILCIDYKYRAALERRPAHVQGDGTSTVAQLIDQENNSSKRGPNYTRDLNLIPVEAAQAFLGNRMSEVPAQGAAVQVVGTANVGTGGTTHDITDVLPDWLITLAEQAARVTGLSTCGVDFLAKGTLGKNAGQQDLEVYAIEINKSPSLFIHERPTEGTPRAVVKQFVDYLAGYTPPVVN